MHALRTSSGVFFVFKFSSLWHFQGLGGILDLNDECTELNGLALDIN